VWFAAIGMHWCGVEAASAGAADALNMRTVWTGLATLALCAACCNAQTNQVPEQPEVPVEQDRDREWFVMGGGKYDSVTGPTASACLCWQIAHPHRTMCSHDFWILQAEAGGGGGKLQFGVGEWYMVGGTAKLSLLRTWGDPGRVDTGQTYAGVECQGNFFLVNAAVGIYTGVDADARGSALLTWSAGIGF
jgi:hypothetical protein